MWNKIKWEIGNFRRHWKMFSFIGIMLYILYRMFMSNYMLVAPIVKKDNYQDPIEMHNELAVCSQSLDDAQAAIHDNNVKNTEDVNFK